MEIRNYRPSDRSAVTALWNEVFPNPEPHNDPAQIIDQKQRAEDDLFFVASDSVNLVGTVMGGYDGHRGWIYCLAVAPQRRGKGIGRELMRHLEHELSRRGCRKINLQVRGGNEAVVAFYEELGYTVEVRVSLGKLLGRESPSAEI